MATVHDVAAYILHAKGPMTAMKLQKLVYYSQAWSLVWDEAPIFDATIQAWANGPVAVSLYNSHRGDFIIETEPNGDADALTPGQRETIDAVLKHYGDKSGQYLSSLTHKEQPWLSARKGLADGERGSVEITLASMAEYYGSL